LLSAVTARATVKLSDGATKDAIALQSTINKTTKHLPIPILYAKSLQKKSKNRTLSYTVSELNF
jgi:S-adenosylmethionine synthetase